MIYQNIQQHLTTCGELLECNHFKTGYRLKRFRRYEKYAEIILINFRFPPLNQILHKRTFQKHFRKMYKKLQSKQLIQKKNVISISTPRANEGDRKERRATLFPLIQIPTPLHSKVTKEIISCIQMRNFLKRTENNFPIFDT